MNIVKAIKLCSITALCLLILASCGESKNYSYPLSRESVQEAARTVGGTGLYFVNLEDESQATETETQTIFNYKTSDNILCAIGSNLRDEGEMLTVMWSMPPSTPEEEINSFYENQLPALFKLTAELCADKDITKVFNKISKEYQDISETPIPLNLRYEVEDSYLTFECSPDMSIRGKGTKNRFGSISVMSKELYEYYIYGLSQGLKNSFGVNNNPVTVCNITELKKALSNDTDKIFELFCVEGELHELKEADSVQDVLLNRAMAYLKVYDNKYLSAVLYDGEESIDVFVQPGFLDAAALSEKRNSYIMKISDDNETALVVVYSVLDKQ